MSDGHLTTDEFCDRHDLDQEWRRFVDYTVKRAVTAGATHMAFIPGATFRVFADGSILDDVVTQDLMEFLSDDGEGWD